MSPRDPRGCGTWNHGSLLLVDGWDGWVDLRLSLPVGCQKCGACTPPSIHQPATKEKETHIPCLSLATSPERVEFPFLDG